MPRPEEPKQTDDSLEYKLEKAKPQDDEKKQEIPEFQQKIKLTPEQEDDIIKVCEANLANIEKQRAEDDSDNRWREYTNQYWGMVQENPNMLFNTHVFLTLIRARKVKSRLYQAFFESDPVFSMSPRPEHAKKKEGFEAAETQEQFLDYELDSEIIIKDPMRKVLHQTVVLDGGILKLPWEREKEWIRRRETYEANKQGLSRFLEDFPDARTKYPGFVKQLEEGEDDLKLVVDKRETIYDAPRPFFIDFADFWIDLTTDGLLGLRKSKFHAEDQKFNWDELQDEVVQGRFEKDKVDELSFRQVMKDGEAIWEIDPDYLSTIYHIFECNLFYGIKEKSKPKRIVVWYCREKRKIVASIYFPYDHGRPYYIPFFLTGELPGWHQPGLARILQPQNIIANAVTNFLLDNAFYQHTPLLRATPNTTVAAQLLAKTWKIGDPLIAEPGEVEKFNLRTGNLAELVSLIKLTEYHADEASGGISAYTSGHADPLDPDAPMGKTLALLRETNINIKDYILCLHPSFQELAYQLLQLFAQFKGTAQFKLKKASVVGREKMFREITPDQLRLRTNITPNAMSFTFDKLNAKRENLALIQFLTNNPVSMQFLSKMPKAQWTLFHILIKSWSDMWNAKVDEVWSKQEDVDEYLKGIQKQAFEEFYQAKIKQYQDKFGQGRQPRPEEVLTGFQPAGPAPAGTPPAGGM